MIPGGFCECSATNLILELKIMLSIRVKVGMLIMGIPTLYLQLHIPNDLESNTNSDGML